MKMIKIGYAYIGVVDRGFGKEAIVLRIDYDFFGSGVITPPIIKIDVDSGAKEMKYKKVNFAFVTSQEDAAIKFGVS